MTADLHPPEEVTTAAPPRTRRRVLTAVAAVVAVTAVGAGAFLLYGGSSNAPAPAATTRLPPATEKVVRGDLVEAVRAIGPIRFSGSRTIKNQMKGIVTWTPVVNGTVDRGGKLYAVDDKPVVLLLGDLPAWRAFEPGMDDGRDVLALEENLAALGYTDFTVDEEFTEKTVAAVKRWQKNLGLPATGKIELGRVVFLSAPVRVGQVLARAGDAAEPGAEVLRTSGANQHVAIEVPLAEQDLAVKGAKATVILPDGGTTGGTIASVGASRLNKENRSVVPVTVRLTDPEDVEKVQNTEVIVELKRVEAKDVLSVPVTALLPREGGGYAVQVVEGTKVRSVPVSTGAFADGRAEVDGPGLAEGTRVGVPKL
ncbi:MULTISPECIES: efflux RND transporter periplasmic adaptor subunit [Streptomyces]|uniref:efflux RND transporter periplasmic adaptor subunit n=1 Tax=Streptomyces TaxID=1883 RepID=UPI0006AF2A85|nr:peptidoglycan-binding protein [Streptomyces sp. AS58]